MSDESAKFNEIILQVYDEYKRATQTYKKINTYHEGYAIVKEELDEQWNEIKKTHYNRIDGKDEHNPRIWKEGIQVIAMEIRTMIDVEE